MTDQPQLKACPRCNYPHDMPVGKEDAFWQAIKEGQDEAILQAARRVRDWIEQAFGQVPSSMRFFNWPDDAALLRITKGE